MKINKSKKSISIILSFVMIISMFSPMSAFALTPSYKSSTATRNKISNSWTYKQRGYLENNCLAWAMGNTTTWIWPFGNKATLSEVKTYLKKMGYKYTGNYNMSQKIYAFGTTNNVTHFARGLGNGPLATPISAKWGRYEVFNHHNTNPYNSISSGSYGSRIASFN